MRVAFSFFNDLSFYVYFLKNIKAGRLGGYAALIILNIYYLIFIGYWLLVKVTSGFPNKTIWV